MGSYSEDVVRTQRALDNARKSLAAHQWPCNWRVALQTPEDPCRARPDVAGWPTFEEYFLRGNAWSAQDYWLYATLTVPPEVNGVRLDGSAAALHVAAWHPFRLYVDGRLLAQEERPWLSTGPAMLPLPEPLKAEHTYQVALWLPLKSHGITVPFRVSLWVEALARVIEDLEALRVELEIAQTLAEDEADRAALEAACSAIHLKALEAGDWERVRASFAEAEQHLQRFSSRAKAYTIHLVGHSHIDMNWLWTWEDTVACVRRDFHSVLELMRDFPELTFSHSQIPTYQIIRDQEPELWQEVLRRVREGRWEVVAATWVEGDLNLANGESIARHLLYAISWCRKHLGVSPKVLWESDTFGHPANIPQLARQAGLERYFHMRCNPGLPNWWPVYWWEGMDGSRILAASRIYNGEISPLPILEAFQRAHAFGSHQGFHMHGVGDHGGGPARIGLETLRRLQQRPVIPTLKGSTMEAFGTAVLHEGTALPVAKGETDTVFEGCYTTHADIKRFNRQGENHLLTAEALAAIAGTDERASMATAWQHVLFNQFHDLLDGSAIHPPYDECAQKHAEVMAVAEAATRKAVDSLIARLDTTGEGVPIVVVNPLGWSRTDVVRLSGLTHVPENPLLLAPDGRRIPCQRYGNDVLFIARDVPALGAAVYHLTAGSGPSTALGILPVREERDSFVVESPVFRATVLKASGILGSLVDKRCGRELVAYGLPKWGTYTGSARPDLALNVFQVCEEAPHGMTAWLINNVRAEHSLLSGARVALVETGPVCAVLRVEHTVRSSRIQQEIIFYCDLDRVDFDTAVDWQEVGSPQTGVPNLKVAFTVRLERPEACYEIPFGAVARPADGQEVPALRWADISNEDYGISLLNDSKYGYDALGSRLRLTLLRSPYEPDKVPDCGEHHFRYCLYPHSGTWREADTVRQGIGFNQPLLAFPADVHAGEQKTLRGIEIQGAPSVILSTIKAPEEGAGLIVRLYESQGRAGEVTLRLPKPIQTAELVNLLEERIGSAVVSASAVRLAFRPWEVKTVRLQWQAG